jgi:hypothetical protein
LQQQIRIPSPTKQTTNKKGISIKYPLTLEKFRADRQKPPKV